MYCLCDAVVCSKLARLKFEVLTVDVLELEMMVLRPNLCDINKNLLHLNSTVMFTVLPYKDPVNANDVG